MIEKGSSLIKLPQGWEWLKLVDACQYLPTGVDEYNGSIEYYSTGSIIDNYCIPEGQYLFSERPSRANRISTTGDVFQARMANTNKAILIKGDLNRKLFSTGFIQLRPFDCCTDMSPYIYYYVQSTDFLTQRDALATGSTQVALTDGSATRISFPLAPLSEQHRIVAKIEEILPKLDVGVTALTKAKLQLRRYRQSILKSAFEGKLTADWRETHRDELEPDSIFLKRIKEERKKKMSGKYRELPQVDISDLPKLPEGWIWVQAEQLCDFITKGTTPAAEKLSSRSGEIPFIKVYNLTNYGVLDFNVHPTFVSHETHTHELARSKIIPGNILMNIVGPPLGKVSMVPDLYPEWNTNQAIAIFRPLSGYDNKLLCFALQTSNILSWAEHRAKATAGQFNLTLEICRALPLPLPSVLEQQQIVKEIERCFSVADEMEKTIEHTLKQSERLRLSILKQAFEGKLVSQNQNDESAEKLLARIKAEKPRQKTSVQATRGRNRRNRIRRG